MSRKSAQESAQEGREVEGGLIPNGGVYVRLTAPDTIYRGMYGQFVEITRPHGYARVKLWNKTGQCERVLLHPESLENVADYEVIGYAPEAGRDASGKPVGSIIQWDATGDTIGEPCPYVCGETPEQYGLDNLSETELARLRAAGWKG